MHKFRAIVKNELYRYFISPLAYVYLLAFLFLNASLTLYLGDFLERGRADLNIMFAFLPWIYLIFISGIAMRLWAEEFKTKTVIQLLTLPISPTQAVWGKFTAAWLFCGIGLLLTFPFVITVNVLGTPDNGIIASGYFACFLLSGAMLAIAQTMSAITKNQVIALVLSVLANLLFLLSGIEFVLGLFRSFAPFEIVEIIAGLSFLSHFNGLAQGLLSAHSILFFISIICLFNVLTEIIIRFKTSGVMPLINFHGKPALAVAALFILLGFAGFNILTGQLLQRVRIDATADSRFTLADTGKNILKNIREPITLKIYYSTILSQRNPLFRQAAEHLHILMRKYQSYADGKLAYRFYHPEPLNTAEDMAVHDKITPIPLPDLNQNAFFGISMVDESGRFKNIPLIPLENLDKIEQDILQNIYELSHEKPTVGILTSLPMFGLTMDNNAVGSRWQIIDEIEKLYHIRRIKTADDLKNIDVLFMLHPQDLTQDLTDAILRYTVNGGKILLAADLAAESERLYSPVNQRMKPTQLNGLDKLWGFTFNPDIVVADLDNSLTVQSGKSTRTSFTQDVIQFSIPQKGINREQPELKYLSEFLLASSTPIMPLKNHPSTFTPLLMTGENSALLPSSVVYENLNPADILPQFQADNTPKVIAAKITGHDARHPYEIIVIGDSDFAYDEFWSKFKMLDEHKYLVYLNDNASFILNALDSLSGKTTLIDLRRGHYGAPRFQAWERLRRQNALQASIEERRLIGRLNDIKIRLNNLWQTKNFDDRQDFSDDELSILSDFKVSLQNLKKQLSDVKIYQNANIRDKQNVVIFFTLYAVPLGIALLLLGYALLHRKKTTGCRLVMSAGITRKSVLFTVVCLSLFCCGLWAALSVPNGGNDYENKPVFADWKNQLNNIANITFKHNGQTLNFYKKDGMWALKGFEDYPFYQRRIFNFLATLANTHYLERKSARAEYLPKFGLDAEHATTIKLSDENNKTLLDFDVGKYDEDIGRGGHGAYLKFNNRFQVWLTDADFISLSTDWRDWTLNTALNSRFGRILKNDKINRTIPLISLIKELINTPLTLTTPPQTAKVLQNIHLTFENNDDITIYFEQSGDKNYIRYVFGKTDGQYLRLFADYAKNKYYEIPQDNMEKIVGTINSALKKDRG